MKVLFPMNSYNLRIRALVLIIKTGPHCSAALFFPWLGGEIPLTMAAYCSILKGSQGYKEPCGAPFGQQRSPTLLILISDNMSEELWVIVPLPPLLPIDSGSPCIPCTSYNDCHNGTPIHGPYRCNSGDYYQLLGPSAL